MKRHSTTIALTGAALLLVSAPATASEPSAQDGPEAALPTGTLVALANARAVRIAALTPTAAAKLRPRLAIGASTPAVVYLQRKLGVKPVSGYYGPLTAAAVKGLQRKNSLPVTGKMNTRTWQVLGKATTATKPAVTTPVVVLTPAQAAAKKPVLKFGMGPTDPAVIFVQQYLGVTPQSGYFGALTQEAVKAYQKGLGISTTGVVGPLTWQAIHAGKKVALTPATPAPDPEAPNLSPATDPGATPTPTPTATKAAIINVNFTLPANPTAADRALQFALAQVGKRYVLGGNGPDVFDCSGLVQQAYLISGIKLPRLASQQINVGTRVTQEQMVPGDLIYYQDGPSPRKGHISMYAGNGLAVEAANPRVGVRVRPLNESWYAERFVAATHIG